MSDEQKTEGCELSPELQKLAEEFRAEMEELYESRRRRAAERANMSEEELIAAMTADYEAVLADALANGMDIVTVSSDDEEEDI